VTGPSADKSARWPMSAGPPELRWWNRLSLLWLFSFLVVGALTTNQHLGGLLLVVGGLIQIAFGAMLLGNRRGFAQRTAEYYSHRPLMLGGFFPNRIAWVQRAQGAAMLLAGVLLVGFGITLILG
jgi:hypothetical protein